MAINFPASPTPNQLFIDPFTGTQYVYSALPGVWNKVNSAGGYQGSQGYTGSSGYTGSTGYVGSTGLPSFAYSFVRASSQYLSITGNQFNFGSNNFTGEAYVYLNSLPSSDSWSGNYNGHFVVAGDGSPSSADGLDFLISTNYLAIQSNDVGYYSTNTHKLSIKTWYHLAWVVTGNVVSFFVNGQNIGSNNLPGATFTAGGGSGTYIGSETGQGAYFDGYIAGLRVTKNAALYSGSSFTPPVPPLTASGNTVLLTGQSFSIVDGSPANNTLINSSSPVTVALVTGLATQLNLGFTGSQGVIGPLGYTGSTGAGYTGSQGITGYVGSYGALGYTGSQGTGYTGSTGAGYTGSYGALGYTGSIGYSGSAGPSGAYAGMGYTGSTGSAAIANAVSQTFTGDGFSQSFSLAQFVLNQNNVLITINGIVQVPTLHYTINSSNLTFTTAPFSNSVVEARNLENGVGSGVGYSGSLGYFGSTGYQGSSGGTFFYTNVPPSGQQTGDRWYNSDYGIELVWTYDGDSYQWVEVTGSGYTGLQGYAGSAGSSGYNGSIGYTGSTGAGYTGSQGATGFAGSSGASAAIGYTGSAGTTIGKSIAMAIVFGG